MCVPHIAVGKCGKWWYTCDNAKQIAVIINEQNQCGKVLRNTRYVDHIAMADVRDYDIDAIMDNDQIGIVLDS